MNKKNVFLGVLIAVAPTVVAIYFESIGLGVLLLISVVLALLVPRFENVVEIAIGPLRAKLERVVKEATASLSQLKSIAKATTEAAVTDMMAGSFMGGIQFSKKLELHDKLIQSLQAINVTDEDIQSIDHQWGKGMRLCFHREICHAIEHRDAKGRPVNGDEPTPDEIALAKEVHSLMNFSRWYAPEIDEIRAVIAKYEGIHLTERAETLLDDYQYYIQTGVVRNPKSFDHD